MPNNDPEFRVYWLFLLTVAIIGIFQSVGVDLPELDNTESSDSRSLLTTKEGVAGLRAQFEDAPPVPVTTVTKGENPEAKAGTAVLEDMDLRASCNAFGGSLPRCLLYRSKLGAMRNVDGAEQEMKMHLLHRINCDISRNFKNDAVCEMIEDGILFNMHA